MINNVSKLIVLFEGIKVWDIFLDQADWGEFLKNQVSICDR